MLSVLHIENIAVIEHADITFGKGFHVLTGETGAGKSIIIDAISAILGQRTYRDVIRTGAKKAFVSAIFTDIPELDWFADNGVEYTPSELLIQREISLDGKNVCRVNGRPVTVAILHQLGMQLINIHGQHDSQQLFDEENHLAYLDLFAGDESLLADYRAAYDQVTALRAEIRRCTMDENEKARRMEMLQHQIKELESAELKEGEDEELEKRRKLLQSSEKLMSTLNETLECLYGSDDCDGASSLLTRAERSLGYATRYGDAFDRLHERVAELMYNAQDVAEEVRDLRDSFDFAAEELEKVESRLDVLHRLRRKYGATCRDMLDFLAQARQELDAIVLSDERLEDLQAQLRKKEKAAEALALDLRSVRKQAAQDLSRRILQELAQLDMPKVRFLCQFDETEQLELGPNGADTVRFLMSANAGEALKPMSRVASGGELARIMLAIKNVLAEKDAVPTLIFDEVDAGVSGRAAQKVAEKLSSVAASRQVLCVTHLPQIAAMADVHYCISKAEKNGRTYTSVTPLDRKGRREELARIIGGATITETTLQSAEEMLKGA
jgi:DNA repair protein RecN (Recombination protein N)